jgi:glucosamine kinase
VAIFLGIDGGGSKTTCVVGNEAEILGTGAAGPSNVVRVGEERARESLTEAIRQACAAADISPWDLQKTCIGIAGGGRSEVSSTVRRILAEIVSGEIEVVGDMITTLEAAFGAGPGVIVIAGTGSVAYGRNSAGELVRVGGWGYAVSDEGSAHWIGREAVSAGLRAEDEGAKSELLNAVQGVWSLASREQLIVAANSRPDFAVLFPTVATQADAGDAVARDVLNRAGRELARLGKMAIGELFRDAASVQVGMSGGVFQHSAIVRELFYNEISSGHPNAVIGSRIVDPVEGALRMARTQHG